MEEKKEILLKVITPTEITYEKKVNSVTLRCIDGDMGILYNHEPCSVLLDYGALQAFYGIHDLDVLAIFGGMATVKNNEVTVITAMAALPDEIHKLQETKELEKTVAKAAEDSLDIDVRLAEVAIRRSLVKMDVSSYPIVTSVEREAMKKEESEIEE